MSLALIGAEYDFSFNKDLSYKNEGYVIGISSGGKVEYLSFKSENKNILNFFPKFEHSFLNSIINSKKKNNLNFQDHGIHKFKNTDGKIVDASIFTLRPLNTDSSITLYLFAVHTYSRTVDSVYEEYPEIIDVETIKKYYNGSNLVTANQNNVHYGIFNSPDESINSASERLLEEFYANLPCLRGKKVLDIGCGEGHGVITLASKHNCKSVTGITISDRQLNVCLEKSKNLHLKNIDFLLMNANEMSFQKESFDILYAMESIFHMDRIKVFNDSYKILSKGGVFALCDITVDSGILYMRNGSHLFLSVSKTIKLLERAGFENIKYIDWSKKVLPMSWSAIYGEVISLFAKIKKESLSNSESIDLLVSSSPRNSIFAQNNLLEYINEGDLFAKLKTEAGYGMFIAQKN